MQKFLTADDTGEADKMEDDEGNVGKWEREKWKRVLTTDHTNGTDGEKK